MHEDDIEYYRRRQQQEIHAAGRAADGCSRNVHLELARSYGLRLAEASAAHAKNAETPRRILSISIGKFSRRSSALDGSGQEFL